MYQIAVCDDDKHFTDILCLKIDRYFKSLSISIHLHIFTEPAQLLHSSINYDLYFLDIRMPEINGCELAASLRNRTNSSDYSLIFVSSMHDAVFDSFRFSPLRFIRKEMLDAELGEAINAFLYLQQNKQKEHIIEVQANRQNILIKISELLSVESYGHYLDFKCIDKTIHVRGRLQDYEPLLNEYDFATVRRGCMVNLKHVTLFSTGNVIMKTGDEIPLSRSCHQAFQKSYMKYQRKTNHVLTV